MLITLHDVSTRPADFDQRDALYGCSNNAAPLFWVGRPFLFLMFSVVQKMQHVMQLLQQGMLSCRETLLLCNDSNSGLCHTFKFL